MTDLLPYLVSDIAPIPGTVKAEYDDFFVEEIPAYEPCGKGDHVYITFEKKGLSTLQAIRDIADALNVKARDVGVAGLKDSRGTTRQTVSIEHADPKKAEALNIPRISIISVSKHGNKLRTGHLRGNCFRIKLRDTDLSRENDLQTVMQSLASVGTPNYYGPQRFGNRGDTWEIGRALIKNDFAAAAEIIAGRAGERDEGRVLEARKLFDEQKWKEAASAWPGGFRECVVVCNGMSRFNGNAERAVMALDKKILGFYISAFQSKLFNDVLALRLGDINKVEIGDAAWKHENGAVFLVEDAIAEAPRAAAFEISPTGPLFGKKMKLPSHRIWEIEKGVLESYDLSLDTLPSSGPFQCPGARRPLRFRPENHSVSIGKDETGEYFLLSFALPPGTFATAVLREICKETLISIEHFG